VGSWDLDLENSPRGNHTQYIVVYLPPNCPVEMP
jgi:hypothetical protein